MLKRFLALGLVLTALQGCGGSSDHEVVAVDADSPFSCAQLNEAAINQDRGVVSNIIQSTLSVTDIGYTEASPIQDYYRDFLRPSGIHQRLFTAEIEKSCLALPSKGVTDAVAMAINNTFSQLERRPELASCASLNRGDLSIQQVTDFFSGSGSLYGQNDAVKFSKLVVASADYGPDVYGKSVTDLCATQPKFMILQAVLNVTKPMVVAIYAKESRAQEAEAKKKKEAKHQQDVEAYSSNLYEKGTATCEALGEQLLLSGGSNETGDGELFLRALKSTLYAIPADLKVHQKDSFAAAVEGDTRQVAIDIMMECNTGTNGLAEAVLSIPSVRDAKTPLVADMTDLQTRLRQEVSGCPGFGECEAMIRSKAADRAMRQVMACEDGSETSGSLCFSDAQTFHDYELAVVDLAGLKTSKVRHDAEIARKTDISYLGEELSQCGQGLIAKGLRGSEYDTQFKSVCEPQVVASARKAFEPTIKQDQASIDAATLTLDQFKSRAVNSL